MTTRIASTNIQSNTILTTNLAQSTIDALQGSTVPTITQIQITTSGYVVKDDTAVSTSGGYIKITGTNFTAGSQVVIGSTPATSVGFVNSTTLNVQVPPLAAGTYVVYVTINTGSVAIIVNGLTYSGDPTWVTGSTLSSSQVDAAISIQLSATGDAPVTYALQAGSSLPAGLTLTSGGLLSGTVTGITVETTYNFTIEAIDAQAQESPRTFSITIVANDQFFENVTTLLSAANPSSTFVTDASTNNFAVTVNGDTRPNSFGPYTPGYYSNFFDGSGDNTAVATNAVFNLGSNNFSFEAWIYPISITNTSALIASQWGLNGDEGIWNLGITSNNFYFQYDVDGAVPQSTVTISTTGGITFNQWQHVLVTRVGSGGNSITRLFINGVLKAYNSVTAYSITSSASPVRLGMQGFTTYRNGEPFHGYISNFRFVNGSVPTSYDTAATTVDTVVFTPPTEPLTTSSQGATSAQVELLLAQSNRFIDNSTNNFTVTRNGDTLISGFDPFTPLSAYSTYGSGYFDGSGDYLSIPDNDSWVLGSNFTIECWVYFTSTSGIQQFINQRASSASCWQFLYNFPNSGDLTFKFEDGNVAINRTWSPTVGQWYHIAVTRSSNTWYLFVNGTQLGSTATNSTSFPNIAATVWVGTLQNPTGESFVGYMTDLRVVKSSVYTANFTPPSAPLTSIANTSLLTLQNNQPNNNNMFLDSSANNFLITRNGNTTQGSFSPYGGGWSNYFDGTASQCLKYGNNTALALGSGNFTVEFWVYLQASQAPGASYTTYLDWRTNGNSPSGIPVLSDFNNNGKMLFSIGTGSGFTQVLESSITVPLRSWTHVALVRSGTTVTLYFNGASVGSGTSSTNCGIETFNVNNPQTPNYNGNYYFSNLRIVKGTAVYTSSFTPPTAPLTPIAGTSLLTCADNRFIDDSANNFAITRNGDVSVQRFNPFNPVLTTPTSYSGYFDGTGDYLNFTGYALGSGNFTIEAWVYLTSLPNAANALYSNGTSDSVSAISAAAYVSSGGNLGFYNYPTATTTSSTISLSTWTHVAIVRNSGTVTLYINGVSGATVSNSNNISDTAVQIMRGFGGITSSPVGYMSNLRVVVGTAVYTGNFTPSTIPLTAIANTRLLTLQNATFIDNSTNNYTITSNGDSVPRQFNPFGWTSTTGGSAAYSATNYGGSMYFDGSGDYLTAASNATTTLTANFTIEFWVYRPASGNNFFFTLGDSFTSTGIEVYIGSTGSALIVYSNGANRISSATLPTVGSWSHVAVVRAGTTVTLYLNGSSLGTWTSSATFSGTTYIGAEFYNGSVTGVCTGYISNVRLVNGTAVYTSNFAPPVAPLSFNANAVLQVNGTGAAIYDSAMMVNYETIGNTLSTGSIKKYGNSSIYIAAAAANVFTPASPNLDFGTGDFTIECFVYSVNSGIGLYPTFISSVTGWSSGASGHRFNNTGAANKFTFHLNGAGDPFLTSSGTYSFNTWYYYALTRSGNTWRMFIDGVQQASGSFSGSFNQALGGMRLGYAQWDGTNGYYNGYLDDLRFTKGVARYTSNFTPPTSPVIQF